MIYLLTIITMISTATNQLTHVSESLYAKLNAIVGHSWVLDSLINLPLENNLVKAGLIGACFMFVWLGGKTEAEVFRRRKILLITLISTLFVLGATKTMSKTIFLPRPFIQSQKVFHVEGDRLVESKPLTYQVPLDEESQKNYLKLQRGEVAENDLGSFPSDHAGFFMVLAIGILLACRSVGLLALGWTFFVILGSRMVTGEHSPLDIAVGSGIGIGVLLGMQFFVGNIGKRVVDPIINWTLKNSALATALIFVWVFESCNTLENIRPIAHLGKDIAKHLIKG